MPLDERQTEEMLLTTAQSIYAVTMIADLRFSVREAAHVARAVRVPVVLDRCHGALRSLGTLFALHCTSMLIYGGAQKRRAFRELPAVRLRRAATKPDRSTEHAVGGERFDLGLGVAEDFAEDFAGCAARDRARGR